MPSMQTILQVSTATMATMFILNQLAGNNARARRIIRGNRTVNAVGGSSRSGNAVYV